MFKSKWIFCLLFLLPLFVEGKVLIDVSDYKNSVDSVELRKELAEPKTKKPRTEDEAEVEYEEIAIDEVVKYFFESNNLLHLIPKIDGVSQLNEVILDYITDDKLSVFIEMLDLHEECAFRKALWEWRSKRNILFATTSQDSSIKTNPNPNLSNLSQWFSSPFGNLLKTKSGFTTEDRVVVATKVAEYLIHNLIKPTPTMFAQLVDEIINIFPQEKGAESVYFKKNEKNKPTGLLYVKYRKLVRNNISVLSLIEGTKMVANCDEEIDGDDENLPNEARLEESLKWLEKHRKPTTDDYPDLKVHWALTQSKRTPKNNNVENWPQYTLSCGYDLIDIDFKYHFRQAFELTRNSLLNFCAVLVPSMKKIIKSPVYKKLCEEINTTQDEDDKFYILLKCMHAMFPPRQRIGFVDDMKKFWKPSIDKSIEGFVQEVKSAHDIRSKLEEIAEQCEKVGLFVQPRIFKILDYKPSDKDGCKYVVCYNQFYFGFNDIILATDCCLKLFFVFHLDYPFESIRFWKFVAHFFYGLPVDDGETISAAKQFNHILST